MSLSRPRSLRVRSALAAGFAVLLGSLLVAVIAVALVQRATTRSLDDALSASASDVLAQLAENPPSSGDPVQLPVLDPRDPVLVQVVDPSGAPVATTPGVDPRARICDATPRRDGVATVDVAQPGFNGTFRVLTTTMQDGSGYVVCAARSDESAEATRWAVLVALCLVILAVTALVVLVVARGVGSALATVADLSREADRLRTLDEGRLTVPDSGDEVAELAVTLNELLDRLHDQQKVTRQFVADAGHELRTPLTSLRLELELAVSDDPARLASSADALVDVERLSDLVDDLLALARSDAGEQLRPTAVSVPECLSEEVAQAARGRDEVRVAVTGSSEVALVDVHAFRRAVRNLLSNAVRHAQAEVLMGVAAEGGWVVLEVLDDGPGVPADQTTRIFERFTRLDDARARDQGGSGLGLAIAAAFAERSGGDVVAWPGPGGRFVLRVPGAGLPPDA